MEGKFDPRRNKNIVNENGLNEVYFKQGKSNQIKEKFYKKNGKIDKFKEWYREDGTLEKRVEYSEGQVHGKTKKYNPSSVRRGLQGKLGVESDYKYGKLEYYKQYVRGDLFFEGSIDSDGGYQILKEYIGPGKTPIGNGILNFTIEGDKYTFYELYLNQISFIAFMKLKDFDVPKYNDPFYKKDFRDFVQPYGKWTVFKSGKVDYKLDFGELSNKKTEKRLFKISNETTTPLMYHFNLSSLVNFCFKFVENRKSSYLLRGKYISYGDLEYYLKGPPGIKSSELVEYKHLKIDDILILSDIEKTIKIDSND